MEAEHNYGEEFEKLLPEHQQTIRNFEDTHKRILELGGK
jgi:hypothetical protein